MFNSDAELLRDLARMKPMPKLPRDKRIGLIVAMGHFRPKNVTPVQFYNFVREFCIMHNCSIDEAMERAPDSWTNLSKDQRKLYNSAKHAALPIPVPRHLIYRAIQMERAGRWKISSTLMANSSSTIYSVESNLATTKSIKHQARLRTQQARYDNLAKTALCSLETSRMQNHPSISVPDASKPQTSKASQQKDQDVSVKTKAPSKWKARKMSIRITRKGPLNERTKAKTSARVARTDVKRKRSKNKK